MERVREEALGAIEGVFGARLKRRQPGKPAPDGALASVFPTSADEVAQLARITDRYSLPLAALGAETTPEKRAKEGRVLIRFDLMRGLWLSGAEEPLAEAEPGALWLELDNDLRVRGRGLTVYPTSAPRATIGGLAGPGRRRGRLLRVRPPEGECRLGRRGDARRRPQDRGRR
jgi:glycolate oxidase